MVQQSGWWRQTNPNIVIPVLLLAAGAVVYGVAAGRQRVVEIERPLEAPDLERDVTVETPTPIPQQHGPSFSAREVSDLTVRRVAQIAEIARAKERLVSLLSLLRADGHRFSDNSVIRIADDGSITRVTYRDWRQSKGMPRQNIPENMRYRGSELSVGDYIEYDFQAIERHARHLWDPRKHTDLRLKRWPGSRYGRHPDAHEQQVIAAHHAIWKAEAQLREISAALDEMK